MIWMFKFVLRALIGWIKPAFPWFPPRPDLDGLLEKTEDKYGLHIHMCVDDLGWMNDSRIQAWKSAVLAVPLGRYYRFWCWFMRRPSRPSTFALDAVFDAVPSLMTKTTTIHLRGSFTASGFPTVKSGDGALIIDGGNETMMSVDEEKP